MIHDLIQLFTRDLDKLKDEIASYQNESNIWETPGDISNSSGNIAMHLIGNLNWFIGAQLGDTDYIRKRELEFSVVDIPKIELIERIDETKITVINSLSDFDDEDLNEIFPIEVFGKPMTTRYFLIHLTTHLAYHLGQVNYHRRIIEG